MASTYSLRFRLNYQAPGDNLNLWGLVLNAGVFQLLEDAIAKRLAFTLSGAKSLTTANGATDEARCAFLDVTGGTGGMIVIPSVEKIYLVRNGASGDVVVTTGGGVVATLTAGEVNLVVCDAANVRPLGPNAQSVKEYVDAVAWSYNAGALPAQGGNAGKFIRTNGTVASWQAIQGTDLANWTAAKTAVRAGTSKVLALTAGDTYESFEEVALTSTAGSIALDMATFLNGYHDLTENTVLANPTNAKVGQCGWIRVRQHASAAKTCATGSNWYRVGGDLAVDPTLSSYNIYEYQVITPTFILYDLLRNPSNV